ncbi:MAG: cbb3-type cytochrome c oxidase subunit I [Caulobacter sp.]|nr:cbb3-type cytochrome c oxidase subunit I [Caulobacter sp.]
MTAAARLTSFDEEADLRARLERTWASPRGLWGVLTAVDHKVIGRRYVVTGMVFFFLAGVLALLMRAQLARPESGLIGPDRYNQIFSMHGTTMMFLFAVPIMEAVAVYLVPLMCGARNISFPRLNAYGSPSPRWRRWWWLSSWWR